MVQEAEEMREADNKRKDGVQVKNDAETLCYQVEKQLTELKEKMSTADADDLKKKMEDVRQCMAGDAPDPEEIKAKTKELQEASWKVTQAAYARMIAAPALRAATLGKRRRRRPKRKNEC